MLDKIASFAAAALIVATIAPPSHAASGWVNGISVNGISVNGQKVNGLRSNGLRANGLRSNGTEQGTSGFAIDGIELPAAIR